MKTQAERAMSARNARTTSTTMLVAALLLLISASTTMVSMASPLPAEVVSAANPGVMPPGSYPYGLSYDEWSARWWQWAFSLPVDQNPWFDDGVCTNGASGQAGPVWFLTGVFNASGTTSRDCWAPAGKALFFPLINVECSTIEPEPFYCSDESTCRTCATSWEMTDLVAEVDGIPIQNLNRYIALSPFFDFTLPENNVLGQPPGTYKAVANGYYLMLAPLSIGEHLIHFGGTFPQFPFTLDITYHMTIVPRKPSIGTINATE